MNNPFTAATKVEKKLKVLVYGESGSGKTWFALTFPGKVAVIDTEGGTELYGGRQDVQGFDVIRTKSFADVEQAVSFIEQDAGKTYQTLVVDPITVIWQVLQDAAMKKYGTQAGTLSFQGWGVIKREYNRLFTRLANLPIHVVVTARLKEDYVKSGNDLTLAGVKPDAEKNTPYIFDIILRLENNGSRYAVVEKDRSGQLPGKIENASFNNLAPIADIHATGEKVTQPDVDEATASTAAVLPEIAEDQPPAPPAQPEHWIDRDDARKAFWRYSKDDLRLNEKQVYLALGVSEIHKFEGSMAEAKQKLIDYADFLSNGKSEEAA
jgi:hypothetical protein